MVTSYFSQPTDKEPALSTCEFCAAAIVYFVESSSVIQAEGSVDFKESALCRLVQRKKFLCECRAVETSSVKEPRGK